MGPVAVASPSRQKPAANSNAVISHDQFRVEGIVPSLFTLEGWVEGLGFRFCRFLTGPQITELVSLFDEACGEQRVVPIEDDEGLLGPGASH